MVVTVSRGVHSARMVDKLVSQLLRGLREHTSWMIRARAPEDQLEVVVGKGVMNTPVNLIPRRLIGEDASHCRTGEVVRRLHSFIVIFVQTLVFQVSVLAGSWGGTSISLGTSRISSGPPKLCIFNHLY